jgi:4-hydroxy-3-polyprenylbenzoate decarboxylase
VAWFNLQYERWGGEVAYRDLRDFIHHLDKKGELRRVSVEVDPILEITEISDRAVKAAGPALVFDHPKGSRIPVVTNLLGTDRRMCMALEVDSLEEVAARVHSFIDMQSPQGFLDKVKMLPKLAEIGSFFPKTVRNGACQEVVLTENFSLDTFPILQCWPQDGGRYITWPMVITKNPENGKRNVGCYRMQVFDGRTTGMHWQTQKHGADHYRSSRAKNPAGRLEVAVAIGADPATALA